DFPREKSHQATMTSTPSTPQQIYYTTHKETLRSIIQTDHFSDSVPPALVSTWLAALDPTSTIPLPPDIKGLYGGDLRSSIPIELAHDSYKYVLHESDAAKSELYARRMLISLALLDLNTLGERDPTLASLALWHKALALLRVEGAVEELGETLRRYEKVRRRSSVSDQKIPTPERLKARLGRLAEGLQRKDIVGFLDSGGSENCARPTFHEKET
ncbi:hypothetical protein DM02DRAFT_516868, partial [Periconia macrospinosa]